MAAPLRNLGFRLLRKKKDVFYCSTSLVKTPAFRCNSKTRCCLTNVLLPSSQHKGFKSVFKAVDNSTSFIIQKRGTTTLTDQNKASTSASKGTTLQGSPYWRNRAIQKMNRHLHDVTARLWKGVWERLEKELVDLVLFLIGTVLLFLGSVSVLAICRVCGVDLRKFLKDKSANRQASQENQEALQVMEDNLKRKDDRVSYLEKELQGQVDANEALREANRELREFVNSADCIEKGGHIVDLRARC